MRFVLVLLAFFGGTAPASTETLVAATTILGSTTITAEDVRVAEGEMSGALTDPADAIGMEARVNLYPGRAIRPSDLRAAAVIGRNDIVTLHYAMGGIQIVTEGRALERAATGDRFRVINLSSRLTVTAVAVGPGLASVGGEP